MVISVDPLYKNIIFALYPSFTEVKEIQQPDNFIIQRDIKSQDELHKVSQFKDCIIISNVLFTERWTEKELCEKALEFRRVNFKSRKKTLSEIESLRGEEFCDALLQFIMTGDIPLQDVDIKPVLNAVGSAGFVELYLKAIEEYPERKLQAAILTFLTKLRLGSSDSLFYKKKTQQLGQVLERNINQAILEYTRSDRSSLAFVNFVMSATTSYR